MPLALAALLLRPSEVDLVVGFGVARPGRAALAYCALFALLSVLTRHAIVVGLIYLLVWEGLLGGLLDGVRWLSITRWAGEIVDAMADLRAGGRPAALVRRGRRRPWSSCGGAGLTGRRLRAFNLTGDE